MSDTKPEPGLYLLDYDGDLLTGYEVVTVNSNGSVEVAIAEASFDVDAGRLTKLSIAADVRKAALADALPEGAKWFPDEGGIMWQGEVYYPADYVLTRTDIQEIRKAALEDVRKAINTLLPALDSRAYTEGWIEGSPAMQALMILRAAALGYAPTTDAPEGYCHRCGGKNLSWWIESDVWNAIMRPDGPDTPPKWNEIICPGCFAELFEERFPLTSFRLSLDENTKGARAFIAALGDAPTGGE